LPQSIEQACQWQEANRLWWESHPMRYDWNKEVGFEQFTKEFYREIDKRFFSEAEEYMPWKETPFDFLIDFDSLRGKDVLEIGVGSGSHTGLLAQYARSLTGIDITDYAVKSTSERMRCFELHATILRMDAERMEFNDNTFDFIWTWGAIHHSSDTRQVLSEMKRVLRPGGCAITMVYHRNFWNWYIMGGLFRGIAKGDLLRTKSIHKTTQLSTDGAIARFYSISEWRALVSEFFCLEGIWVFGTKSHIVPLPGGKVKNVMTMLLPNYLSRFVDNRCKLGGFLVSMLRKNT
jgi:ubiquinone/menaquinone biosynthesis C-methylase UbiE